MSRLPLCLKWEAYPSMNSKVSPYVPGSTVMSARLNTCENANISAEMEAMPEEV
jgi:hypothetical protein